MTYLAPEVQAALPRLAGLARRVATLAAIGQPHLLARQMYADDAAHRAEHPDHMRVCACGLPFDRFVSVTAGKHHTSRPADYCSYECTERYRPSHILRRANAPTEPPPPYRETDVRHVLSRVRAHLVRGIYWAGIYRQEWALLELGAPEVATGLRYYEDVHEAQRRATSGAKRLGKAQAERLRGELVERIDSWFRENDRSTVA